MPGGIARVDAAGLGLNATDTIIRVPHYPEFDSKVAFQSAQVCLGGQVATAMTACRCWGMRTRYVGKLGDDAAAELHRSAFAQGGVEARLITVPNCASQSAYIIVEGMTGERTILWHRDPRLETLPDDINLEWIRQADILLVDGHETSAATSAAACARQAKIPVVADIDDVYSGLQVLLEYVNFLISSKDFPQRLTGEKNLLKALPEIQAHFRCYLTGATLGRFGALVWDGHEFVYSPGFCVRAVDTTGAGDIFHAAFVYGLHRKWPLERALEFCNAAAGLSCTAVGGRGRIARLSEIESLIETGERSEAAFPTVKLARAGRAV